jgi:hypothetical protein
MEGDFMHKRRFSPAERLGINAVERIVAADMNWIWREQAVADFGVDGQIEVASSDGKPTGRLIAVQVNSGLSYFRGNGNSFPFRASIMQLN